LDLIDDCERFVLRSFDGVKQSAMHVYHSALPWTPTSSPTRQLYECELIAETKLVNAVGPTWDSCIRIIPVAVGKHIEAVVFSPSGALIAAHGGTCVKVFDAMTGVNRATFDKHTPIFSFAFSSEDSFLVSGLCTGTINVWDIQTGTMFRTFKGNMWNSAYSVAFSPCGTMIASGYADGTVRIWNILSGSCNGVFQGHLGTARAVCWLATRNQVVSASDDFTVRIWDVQKQTCLKIFAQYHDPVTAVAFSRGLLLVASKNGTVNIHDSQSGGIIHIIRSGDTKHSCFSIDGGKVLVARRNSGDIWDIGTKTLMHVRRIKYNGEQATFSPDGNRIASIYGKFLKIWKTDAGYNHHDSSTHVHDTVDDIYISSDERLVTLKSEKGANILDATTGQSLFTYPVSNFQSIGFSLDLAFIAFLKEDSIVQIWNAHTRHYKSIAIDNDVFDIALSPDGSQLASLSRSHMKLWDLKSEECLAHLEFDWPLQVQAQISVATNATSVSVLKNSDGVHRSWHISPNHNIGLTRKFIKNSGDRTKSWLISHPSKSFAAELWPHIYSSHIRDPITNRDGTKLSMVFIPTMEEQSNRDASMPCQSYCCDTNGEWILDQEGRCILWIPPDERPRKFWCFKHKKMVLIHTESKKVYYVNFSQS
jgi:WD40 repeat protein